MVLSDSSRVLRWSRWGVLLAATVMAVALVLPTWFAYLGVNDAAHMVARGQGQAIVEGIIGRLRAIQGPPSASDLHEIREALVPSGLLYVRLGTTGDLSDGERAVGKATPWYSEPGAPTFATVADRVRMSARVPPPGPGPGPGRNGGFDAPPPAPRGPDHAPPGFADRPPPRDGRVGPPAPEMRGPPPLVIEFDPGPANTLVARARTSLVINSFVACGLLLAAGFAFFWMRRQERGEVSRARERHLATLGEMSAVLAHEIRNPLASLKGHAQLLAESLEGMTGEEAKANRVVNEAIRLETLTTDLLDFVRTGEIRRTEVSPSQVLRRAADELASDRIVLHCDAAPDTFALDADRIQQALGNLLRNGLQADGEGEIRASATLENGRLVFTVQDHGAGIPEDQLESMFAPFHTTKVRGTGLGLAVVRRIVELHGGTVVASNLAPEGAQFRIEIPEAR